jgi:hypothetical protein
LNSSQVAACHADLSGGGVFAANVLVNHGVITENSAQVGGGIDAYAGLFHDADITLLNSTVSGNSSGALVCAGTAEIYSSLIEDNDAKRTKGGGIYASAVMLSNSTLSGNTSASPRVHCSSVGAASPPLCDSHSRNIATRRPVFKIMM